MKSPMYSSAYIYATELPPSAIRGTTIKLAEPEEEHIDEAQHEHNADRTAEDAAEVKQRTLLAV